MVRGAALSKKIASSSRRALLLAMTVINSNRIDVIARRLGCSSPSRRSNLCCFFSAGLVAHVSSFGQFSGRALLLFTSLSVASCAGSSTSQRDFTFVPDTKLTVVALIDGDFLAGLPQDDQSADFTHFAPLSIAFRPDQMLVIADAGSNRVYGVPLDPGVPRFVYTAGFSLQNSQFLRTDPIGNVYVIDGGRRTVQIVDPRFRLAGEIVPPFESLGLVQGRICGLAFNPMGELYLSDPTNARIYRYDASGRFVSSFTGGEEVSWGQLLQPEGLAVANSGTELYVCDAGKRQVVVFDPSGLPLRIFGGTDLEEPWAVAVNGNGQAFVADRKGQSICVFNEQGSLIGRIDGPPVGDARWEGPTDVVIHDSSLVVADPPSGRIIIMKLAP